MMWPLYIVALIYALSAGAVYADVQATDAFSPRQGATALIVSTIGAARQSIYVAAYSFTSHPIADALVDAEQRGVDVRVVMDKSQRKGRHRLADFLLTHGVQTRINSHYAIMHDKFLIVDNQVLELGSFNYTKAAEDKNAENVLVIRGQPQVIEDYIRQWQKLWDETFQQDGQ
jgi:phosphatidylserine/phosphatidylglycerophosphate/cardiolipin synthase-like enzyme